jgi:hypothetical protein
MVLTELGEDSDNYATVTRTGCVVPRARLATYVACAAYVACKKCPTPYASAVGHHYCKCKAALYHWFSQRHHGARALVRGSDSELLLCDK